MIYREEIVFIRGLNSDRNDDSLRLIYADWLEDLGDPRSGFLRLELEIVNTRLSLFGLEALRADMHSVEQIPRTSALQSWLTDVGLRLDLGFMNQDRYRAHMLRAMMDTECAQRRAGSAALEELRSGLGSVRRAERSDLLVRSDANLIDAWQAIQNYLAGTGGRLQGGEDIQVLRSGSDFLA